MDVKRRVEISTKPVAKSLMSLPGDGGGVVNVMEEKIGKVNLVDKFKGYYKGAIAFVGMLLIVLEASTPIFSSFQIDQSKIVALIAALTTVGVLLKKNQTWVDSL